MDQAIAPPSCPKCKKAMYDNCKERRQAQDEIKSGVREKAAPPAFKCKDKACGAVLWEATGEEKKPKSAKIQRPKDAPKWAEDMEVKIAQCDLHSQDVGFDSLYKDIVSKDGEWREWCAWNLFGQAIMLSEGDAELDNIGRAIATANKVEGLMDESHWDATRAKYKERKAQLGAK